MKINDKYTFDLNFVEERTQQIFDFHNFIDRCLVEMRDIHLLEYGLVLHLDLEYRLDSFHVHLTYQKLHQPQ